MSDPTYAWHHVHAINMDWDAAATWHDEHTPARRMPWDHDGGAQGPSHNLCERVFVRRRELCRRPGIH